MITNVGDVNTKVRKEQDSEMVNKYGLGSRNERRENVLYSAH